MIVNLKYKFYKSNKVKKIDSLNLTACIIWNHITALQKRYYKLYGKYINTNRMQKHIAKLRKKNTFWIKLNSQSVQEICQRHDKSYQAFFKYCKTRKGLKKRPPKFKAFRNFSSFCFKNTGWKIKDNAITINKIGRFKFHKSREYENIKRITFKKDKLGDYYLVLTCDMPLKKYKRGGNSSIGLDFGLKTYLTHSDGTEINSPLFFNKHLSNIRTLSKDFSRKIKGSNNKRKALKKLTREYQTISNKRSDFQWKLAHELCKYNSFIAIEDLNMEGMKRLWGKKISDLSFSDFVLKLEHVAKKYGTVIQKVGRYFPSSKLCYCGVKNTKLTLKDREWICTSCGSVNDRDLLAANNILTEGIRLYRTKYKTSDLEAI